MPRDIMRLVILHASVGTGHTAAAEALREWCLALCPESEVMFRDLLSYAPSWLAKCVKSSYLAMARGYPWIWERLYKDSDSRSSLWNWLGRAVSRPCLAKLLAEMRMFRPHAVIATHFFGMSALLDNWEHGAPIYFVGTDYATHCLQRDPRFDGWFVGSGEASRQYRADRIPAPERTVMDFGIPIARAYSEPPDRAEARGRLDVGGETVMVSITGGGIGAGALDIIASSMLEKADWRIEVLCGSNRRAYETLRDKYYPFKQVNVRGYVNNMWDYYAASDIVVAKPGGLTAAEGTASGAVMLLMDPLPGVERYNCDYLLEHGAARKIYEVRKTGEQIEEILSSPSEARRLSERAKAIGRPFAARDIIEAVADAGERSQSARKS
jgi:processive 1,2-diacylglycerol beta-glucosyltransferase